MDATVVDMPERDRYEVRIAGEPAGYVEYMATEQVIVFTHTEVYTQFNGQGLGGVLAKGVLDAARRDGRGVLLLCPYMKDWVGRHPEYADLLVEDPQGETANG